MNVTDLISGQVHEGMNRPLYTSGSNSSNNGQPLSQAPPSSSFKQHPPSINNRFHSRNTSDPQDYHRRPPPSPASISRYENEDDTEDADEEDEEDTEMTAYSTRSGLPNVSSGNGNTSRPGSSSKDSSSAIKKPKTKSNKVFQCTGYGDCTMQFTRSEHLARHIRLVFRGNALTVRKHTGERPFHCDCGRNFSRLDNLRQHMTTVHAQQYPPPSSNAPPARQQPQTKPSGSVQLPPAPHRSSFKYVFA